MKIPFVAVAVLFLAACGTESESGSATDEALDEVKRLYDKALDKAPENPVEWAREDIMRYGDWQYRVVEVNGDSASALEQQLNEFGSERWEVFWVDKNPSGLRVFLKRPAKSYLRSIDLPDIGGGQ